MRNRVIACLVPLVLVPSLARAQTVPVEGLRERPPGVHALTGARIVVAPGRTLEQGTIVIRDGIIEAVGAGVTAPPDARLWDMTGRTIYAGFIDPYSDVGMRSELPEEAEEARRGAVYWSPQVRSFVDAASELAVEEGTGPGALRTQGFTTVMVVPRLGLFRGQTAVVSLRDGPVAERVVAGGVAQSMALRRDVAVDRGYPTSAMGAVAFIRQTFHDADWHARAQAAYRRDPRGVRRPELNAALAALAPVVRGDQPLVIHADDDEDVLRGLSLRDEFPLTVWIRGSGREYRRLDELAGLGVPLILPVDFPPAPEVDGAERVLNLTLAQLRHWQRAPENPGRLAAAGIEFALTSDGLEDRSEFLPNVRVAVARGLDPDVALAALTTVPARLLGIEGTHGTIDAGKAANLVVADGDVFADGTELTAVWVDGRRFQTDAPPGGDPRGEWRIAALGAERIDGTLTLEGAPSRLTGTFAAPGAEATLTSARVAGTAPQLQVAFPGDVLGHEGTVRLSASVTATALHGWGELPDGRRFNWVGERIDDGVVPNDVATRPDVDPAALPRGIVAGTAPDGAEAPMEFGRLAPPEQPRDLLVRGATVWTMGPDGIIADADLHVRQGRVVRVGRDLPVPAGATIVEAAGRHVTPGLIDPHIHSGVTGGVNETGSAIVPEVRIRDVLSVDNIWMYRQLAGGLTTAHVMHGSANPIGGQNQTIKLRWGATADGLHFEGAPRTVKFALGENPVRRPGRYPDTRMGVDEIIRDHFRAARAYEAEWQAWERNGRRGLQPRRDLRMDAIVEILNGDILIQSHCYRQDEILMLMRLVEDFDFRVHAFHHGVEAYKVGPELAAHGAAAVVWSDWSSFKVEAYDATTYNARLLLDAGVLTALHSDNAQIASRMNWEAAKMLRTGIDEVRALALVTLNAARVLGVDGRVGSLEAGKDADFVVWSGHPLSSASHVRQTWVDGRRYFDVDEDRELRQDVERERSRLVQMLLDDTR